MPTLNFGIKGESSIPVQQSSPVNRDYPMIG